MVYVNNYSWLFYDYSQLLVIIKLLFVIILSWHVSLVCINTVAVFCLFMVIMIY